MYFCRFFALLLTCGLAAAAKAQTLDYFHDKLELTAAHFAQLNIPDLEKIQIPQPQPDGSHIFIYIWLPQTHRPTSESFDANIADYFDIIGASSKAFDGWCYMQKPERVTVKGVAGDVGVLRVRVMSYYGRRPKRVCAGGFPGSAGRLGQTQVVRDPNSGLLSMVRSGYPTKFPSIPAKLQQ